MDASENIGVGWPGPWTVARRRFSPASDSGRIGQKVEIRLRNLRERTLGCEYGWTISLEGRQKTILARKVGL